jgi:hypothetical protein
VQDTHQTPPKGIPEKLAQVLEAIADIKSEMGTIQEIIKTLSAGPLANGTTPEQHHLKRSRTQQEIS